MTLLGHGYKIFNEIGSGRKIKYTKNKTKICNLYIFNSIDIITKN